jgi:hypothetical protein
MGAILILKPFLSTCTTKPKKAGARALYVFLVRAWQWWQRGGVTAMNSTFTQRQCLCDPKGLRIEMTFDILMP